MTKIETIKWVIKSRLFHIKGCFRCRGCRKIHFSRMERNICLDCQVKEAKEIQSKYPHWDEKIYMSIKVYNKIKNV